VKLRFGIALACATAASAPALAWGQPHGDAPPRKGGGGGGNGSADAQGGDDSQVQVTQRVEPNIGPPPDPLAMSPEMRARIGTDWDGGYAAPEGQLVHRKWFPYYEESRGDYRMRLLPPLMIEETRGLPNPETRGRVDIPQTEDTQGLYGLLYYRRRSLQLDEDVLFPLLWRVRDRENNVVVAGPLVHREAPGEHDNWLAPFYFTGSRPDGGYFHIPPLLMTSRWTAHGAFTLIGPYFRDRTETDVDSGVLPFFFHGDNGSVDGNRTTYTLIPPLLYYNRSSELEESTTNVFGPLYLRENPKRSITDFVPFVFHIHGKPESGGKHEDHLTVFPLFHVGHDEEEALQIFPGVLHRETKTSETWLTPLISHATTRNGATSLWAFGPVLPLLFTYRETDTGVNAFGLAPFYYVSDSPAGHDFLTPFFGKFESYGVSRTYYAFPSVTVTRDTHGWSTNLLPIFFMGRSDESSHTVIAPVFWDFASDKGRTTIGFPLYWRFADTTEGSVFQIAANTLYTEKPVPGGKDWQFHLLPLVSFGGMPQGYWWNLLFGLAGFTHDGPTDKVRAFWIPIQTAGP
jgi:hypothetical protein